MANVVNMKNEEIAVEEYSNKVVFSNKGEIDIRAITTLGISAKDNNSAIGYFGTGLKYAIAVLLREGQKITIWSGKNKYEFMKSEIDFRGKAFQVITMNGQELPITTDYGKNWKVWQAYRELHCNCTDEFGEINLQSGEVKGIAGKTIIVCEGEKIEEAFKTKAAVILEGEPFLSTPNLDILAGQTHHLYYKKIRAFDTKHCLFTYNIKKHLTLTEDRTIAYGFEARSIIMNAILGSNDKNLIKQILAAPEGTFEHGFDFSDTSEASASASDSFTEVAVDMVAKSEGSYSLGQFVERHRKKDAGEIRVEKNLSEHQKQLLDAGLELATAMGFPVSDYPIMVTDMLGYSVLGLAEGGKIYISSHLFASGVKKITAVLIEEYLHLEYEFKDESRQMQNYLFDKVVELGAELHNKII